MRIARKKETVDDANFVNTVARTQEATEGLMNPFANSVNLDAGASHHSIPSLTNVNPKIYPPQPTSMPLRGVYTYPYMPSHVIPNPSIIQVDGNSATIFTQFLPLQSLEELKEQEREIKNDDAI